MRVSKTLKNRLQASLSSLTAREAGRLLAIYYQEAEKKGVDDIADYPPVKDLWSALKSRVDRSRGKTEEAATVNVYNGVIFLDGILSAVNGLPFSSMAMAVAFDAYQAKSKVSLLLLEDVGASLSARVKDDLAHNTPHPVSREDYRLLLEWGEGPAFWRRSEVLQNAYFLYWDMIEKEGSISEGTLTEEVIEEKANQLGDRLEVYLDARVEAGELAAYDGVYHYELDNPTRIVDGKLPAWAALRLVWKPFLGAKGYRIKEKGTFEEWTGVPVDQLVDADGKSLDDKGLEKLALDFYKLCRSRPWGKGLITKPDLKSLVSLLIQSPNPFLHILPFDFGLVDWETFRQNERNWNPHIRLEDNEVFFQSEPLYTVGDLKRLDYGDLPVPDWSLDLEDQFYPTPNPDWRRRDLGQIFKMLDVFIQRRQPFTYGFNQREEGELSLSELLGVDFLTPLEEAVAKLQDAINATAGLHSALRILSDRYFGGLPILLPSQEFPLTVADESCEAGAESLALWLDRLAKAPWNVNTESLKVTDPTLDEDFAETLIRRIIESARRNLRSTDSEEALIGKE